MAKNKTGGGATIDGVTVVHPDNIGHGLLWDEATKTYYVAVDDRTFERDELGRLRLRVSALEDNQLQLRNDGIYQGVTAPVHLQRLYVSNQGSDANDGTKKQPLQTITGALNKIAADGKPGSYTILLKAGQTFIENKQFTYLSHGTVNVTFTFYDDPKYGESLWDSKGGIWIIAADDLNHPRIIWDTFVDGRGSVSRASFGAKNLVEVVFLGVDVTLRTTNGPDAGGASLFYCETLDFQGTDFRCETAQMTFGSAKNILLRQTTLSAMPENGFMFVGDYAPTLFHQVVHFVGQSVTGNEFSFTVKQTNLDKVLKAKNAVALTTFNAQTKTFFGWSANWDIFANT